MIHDPDGVSDLDQIRSRYHLLRELGRDGPHPVYAVRALDSDRHFLLKVIEETGSRRTRAGALQSWQAHTVKPLDHPKLMVMHAVHYLQGGAVAVAMDRRRGRTLAELMGTGGSLSVSRVEHILRDVAEALEYLHGRDVVHRGVRPHSIYLDYDRGHSRLAFFGVDHGGSPPGEAETGALIRQFAYLAPEQIAGLEQVDGRRLSPRSDLFSLGLVGYTMLTGRQPWQGAAIEDLVRARKREPLAPIEQLRPDAPEYLREAIARCLEPNPRRRCGSAREFLALLDPTGHREPRPQVAVSRSFRRHIGAGVRSVPRYFPARIDPAAARKAGVVAAAAIMGLLAFSALRATDDTVARTEADLHFETTTVLELPVEPSAVEEERIQDAPGGAAAPSESAPRRRQSPSPSNAETPIRTPAAPRPAGGRALPTSPPRQNLASAGRVVLLGEPISRSSASIVGEVLGGGGGPR